eukprot:CAMPEP_0204821084 /NCGR_PEP_ID=MMETSP1018-20131115/2225_1 /ASSEMBLY_ACC=CAM_ASM_000518 /TAXON_ID=46462 /ORGANISM="Anophryoides haemophila, Strain AH6" /LENGTH=63 /DNA_ID=CAMNT_0051919691 /DNA_START=460 /DNA_END=651 /DNA_ORIENTATION=-
MVTSAGLDQLLLSFVILLIGVTKEVVFACNLVKELMTKKDSVPTKIGTVLKMLNVLMLDFNFN